jgi:serine/threonine-protein kinase
MRATSERPPLRPGDSLGRYRIEGLLGAGGMGRVYLALDRTLRRTVAIKVADGGAFDSESTLREARVTAALCHPSICAVYEVGHLDGHDFIVLEHVKGVRLSSIIHTMQRLPVEVALHYELQLADAVAHAHDRDIIHGDINSSNVLVATDGRVKVLDFGLAVRRAVTDASDAETTNPSASPSLAGTVPYMAPERLRGDTPDERSDIWALGVLLFEMVTGSRPFRGVTPYELASHILCDQRSAPSVGVPPAVAGVIERCLSAPPAHRFPNVRALMAALDDIEFAARGAAENDAPWPSTRLLTALS